MHFKQIRSLNIAFALLFLTTHIWGQSSNSFFGKGDIDFSFQPREVFTPLGGDRNLVVFQTDGKVLSAGRYSFDLQGTSSSKLYRFLPDGQIDTGFNPYHPAPTTIVDYIALQSDGKIVYACRFINSNNRGEYDVFRLNTDGSLDNSFNYDFSSISDGLIRDIDILSNGKILIGGAITERGDNSGPRPLLRLNSDGSIDTSFSGTNALGVQKFIAQTDGRILTLANGTLRFLSANGEQIPSSSTVSNVTNFLQLTNGKVITVNQTQTISGYNQDLTLDATFTAQNTVAPTYGFNSFSNNEIILSGCASPCGFNSPTTYQILNSNGSLKRTFPSYFSEGEIFINAANEVFIRGESMYFDRRPNGLVKLKSKIMTRRKAFDFDGDGKADIAVYRPSNGVWYIYNSGNNTFSYIQFGLAEDKPVTADYDGDSKADIAVYRPSNGVWYILKSSNGQYVGTQFGVSEDVPTQNDYDGDGIDDVAVYRPSTGVWYHLSISNGTFGAFQFGVNGDKALAGDYDGDGRADYAVWRPFDGLWYFYLTRTNSVRVEDTGYYKGDLGTPMDLDGDGRLDVTYWKDINGDWYGTRSSIGNGVYSDWGESGDVPVPADYDGDGLEDFAIWRPSTGTWWIIRSSDGGNFAFQFGANGDIPIPSSYIR